MKLIVCIDDNNGMQFNGRRQSRDRVVIREILNLIGNENLFITEYSKTLFPNATIVDSFVDKDGFAFIEDADLLSDIEVDKMYIFKWNRSYPFDKKFSVNFDSFLLRSSIDFDGFSHEKITLEVYEKRGTTK